MMKHLQIFLLLCGVVWVPILLTYSYNTQSREGEQLLTLFNIDISCRLLCLHLFFLRYCIPVSFTSFVLMLVFCFYNFVCHRLQMIPLGMLHRCFLLESLLH